MKKIFLLFFLLLCLITSNVKAQGYYKFLNNSSWCEAVNSGFGIPINYFFYNQTNDTVINTKTYAKIFDTGNHSTFFIREDTINKKVYILDSIATTEVILYDFSLNVGDTLYAQHGWGAGKKLIVRTIDTVTILVGQRRRFFLSDTSGHIGFTAIESVGSINDPFLNNSDPTSDPQFNLVCSYQKNIQVFDGGTGYICYPYGSQPCDASFSYIIMPNGQVIFTNNFPGYSSHWTFGGYIGAPDTTVFTPSIIVTFPCNSSYTIQCQVSMTSSGTNTCNAPPQVISISNIPNSLSANYMYTIGTNGQINFTNTTSGTSVPSNMNYFWYIYDSTGTLVAQSNLSSPSFTLATDEKYIVTLWDYDYPCNSSSFTDTIYIPAITATGIVVFSNSNTQINIHPNPANNIIHVEAKETGEIKLFDVLGKEILSTKENEIDISSLTNGVYFIQVNTKENNYMKKIIVQH